MRNVLKVGARLVGGACFVFRRGVGVQTVFKLSFPQPAHSAACQHAAECAGCGKLSLNTV
jgi:hypothetical protein